MNGAMESFAVIPDDPFKDKLSGLYFGGKVSLVDELTLQ
jgi:hypothetical protein